MRDPIVFLKSPGETKEYQIDWSDWLQSGETITTSEWTLPSGVTLVNATLDGPLATAFLSSGVAGQSYLVINKVTTATRTEEQPLQVEVVGDTTNGLTLVVPSNSFQSYGDAIMIAREIPNIPGWEGAADRDRLTALLDAYDRLTRIGFRIPRRFLGDWQSRIEWTSEEFIPPLRWSEMTLQRFNDYHPRFKTALRKAQVCEADVILGGDVIADRRRAGLLSESIGESSMMFRSGKPLNLGISHRSLEYLSGFVDIRITMGRAS